MTEPSEERGESAKPARASRVWVWLLLAILALFAIQLGRAWKRAGPWPGLADSAEYDGIASRLLASGRYLALAHGIPGAKYAVRAPGYPVFLAGCYLAADRIGLQRSSLVRAAQAGLALATVLLVYLLGARSGRRSIGLTAAFLMAIYPPTADSAMVCLRECLLTLLTAAGALLLVAGFQRGRARAFILAGLLLGVATLVRTGTMALPVALAVVLAFRFGWRRVRPWALACAFAAAFAAALLPWAVRNWMIFGRPVALSSLNGLNLWVGNYLPYQGITRQDSYPMIARIVRGQRDEMAADSHLTRVAVRMILSDLRHHPVAYGRLIVLKSRRLWDYWDVSASRVSSNLEWSADVLHPGLLVLGGIGLGVALLGIGGYAPLVLIIAFTVGAQVATICESGRFNYPIMPLVAVLAAVGLRFVFSASPGPPEEGDGKAAA